MFCVSVKYKASCHGRGGLQRCLTEVNGEGRGLQSGRDAIIFGQDVVRVVAVIAVPHSPGIYCSCGSHACLLPCPPCCETHYCPGAGSDGMEPRWPTCVCPYSISQQWPLFVQRGKTLCIFVSRATDYF